MSTSFRLRVCIRDNPGALLRILKTLSGQMQDSIEQDKHQDTYTKEKQEGKLDEWYEVVPDIHMFTLKRCSRFPILYTTNPRIAGSLFLKPHYLFHAIIELKLRKRHYRGKNEEEEKKDESKTIAVLELHACLIASDRGVNASNFRKFIQSLTKQKRLNINEHIEDWTNLQPPEEVIYAGTLSPLSVGKVSEYLGTLKHLRDALQNIVVEETGDEDTECPERGTCPLGFIVHNKENLRDLYKHKFTRTLLISQDQGCPSTAKRMNYDVYLTFIRDHECYAKYRSFEEYYGIIVPSKGKEQKESKNGNSNSPNNRGGSISIEKFTHPFKVNSVIIDVVYVSGREKLGNGSEMYIDGRSITRSYIKNILNDLKEKDGRGKSEYLTNIDSGKGNKSENENGDTDKSEDRVRESYYIVSKYFTCEDPSCDVTRRFMPKLSLPRVI